MFLFGSSPCIYLVPSDTTSRQHLLFSLSSSPAHLTHIACGVRFISSIFCSGLVVRYSDNWRTTNPANCTGCVVNYPLFGWYSSPSIGLNALQRGLHSSFFPLPDKWLNVQQYQTHGCFSSRYRRRLPSTSHRLTLWYSLTWKMFKFLCFFSFPTNVVSLLRMQHECVSKPPRWSLPSVWALLTESVTPGCRRRETTRLRNAVNVACVFV